MSEKRKEVDAVFVVEVMLNQKTGKWYPYTMHCDLTDAEMDVHGMREHEEETRPLRIAKFVRAEVSE